MSAASSIPAFPRTKASSFLKAALLDRGARPDHQTGLYWYGAIAQLGERLHGMQEVSGSIPLGSTNSSSIFRVLQQVRESGHIAAPCPVSTR